MRDRGRTPKTEKDGAWPEALATVTACKYQFGAGRALAFGVPSSRHFLITFNYYVAGELHTGELLSAVAMPQGHLFPLSYNPERPQENSHASASPPLLRAPFIALGIAGSVVLSLAWFLLLRGCS